MDEVRLATMVQRWDDFMASTIKYRETREAMDEKFFERLGEIQSRLDKLPCDGREKVANQVHIGINKEIADLRISTEKDSNNQWVMIGVVWTVIGAISYSIFEAWLKIWSGNR